MCPFVSLVENNFQNNDEDGGMSADLSDHFSVIYYKDVSSETTKVYLARFWGTGIISTFFFL